MTAATAIIRKDILYPSRPWCADVTVDGKKHVSAYHGFKTKKSLVQDIQANPVEITIQ